VFYLSEDRKIFNIDRFRASGLVNGGARPSLFKVRFTAVPEGIPDASLDLEFLAKASQIPASTLAPVEVPYFGRTIKLAGNRSFADWTITVMNDEGMKHRNMFEAWHNKINTLVSNRQNSPSGNLLDYKVSAEVLQYGKAGPGDDSGVIRAYQFEGLWPIEVSAMALAWESQNQIQEFDVTFSYDYWIPSIFAAEAEPYSPTLSPDPAAITRAG
jgi:hypothetical protein